ncbi:hypothetical protein EGJ15_26375, partial [Pseudomonas sp. p99-361]
MLGATFGPVVAGSSVLASSRACPLPQEYRGPQACAVPVGAGKPAKRPVIIYLSSRIEKLAM